MTLRSIVIALALNCLVAIANAQRPPRVQAASYDSLLKRLQTKDTSIDFTALRIALTKSDHYAPYGSDADLYRDSLRAALQRQDFRRVLTYADSALSIDYLDIRTHVLRAYAAEELGDSSSGLWDRAVAGLLVHSIAHSGSGTVDSPYVVISVDEEYALLGMTGYQSNQQSLGRCGSTPCDILEAHNPRTGDKRTFYFDITLPAAFLNRMFQPK